MQLTDYNAIVRSQDLAGTHDASEDARLMLLTKPSLGITAKVSLSGESASAVLSTIQRRLSLAFKHKGNLLHVVRSGKGVGAAEHGGTELKSMVACAREQAKACAQLSAGLLVFFEALGHMSKSLCSVADGLLAFVRRGDASDNDALASRLVISCRALSMTIQQDIIDGLQSHTSALSMVVSNTSEVEAADRARMAQALDFNYYASKVSAHAESLKSGKPMSTGVLQNAEIDREKYGKSQAELTLRTETALSRVQSFINLGQDAVTGFLMKLEEQLQIFSENAVWHLRGKGNEDADVADNLYPRRGASGHDDDTAADTKPPLSFGENSS
jgi:hypothetical protein